MRLNFNYSHYTARMAHHMPYLIEYDREDMFALFGDAMPFESDINDSFGNNVVNALNSYGVKVKLHSVECGPVLVRVNVIPEVGVRVKNIENLSDELAIAMKASKVSCTLRPEIGCVALDFPSSHRQIVRPAHIAANYDQAKSIADGMELPIEIGVGVTGTPKVIDLTKTPHMLIAGQTGSGKSVCINSIIASLYRHVTEFKYELMLIDPKGNELGKYKKLPNVINHSVLVSPEDSLKGLNYLVKEMERRYAILSLAEKRNIVDFNNSIHNIEFLEKIPMYLRARMKYIVCVVDEFCDLMMNCGKELTDCVMKLAQKSRAVGIHVILATQRPSVDVVTGPLKANLPTRIAFKVASQTDSRTILDCAGAEKLLGNGDMLIKTFDTVERCHGVYYSDETIDSVIQFIDDHTRETIETKYNFDTGKVYHTDGIRDAFMSAIYENSSAMITMLKRNGYDFTNCLPWSCV